MMKSDAKTSQRGLHMQPLPVTPHSTIYKTEIPIKTVAHAEATAIKHNVFRVYQSLNDR